MLAARLTDLDYKEILTYLGSNGDNVPEDEISRVKKCAEDIIAVAEPKLVYKRVRIENGAIDGLELKGKDIWKLLKGAHEAVVFSATVGLKVDQLIAKLQVVDMSLAVIADASASAAVENVCNNFESDMRKIVEGEGLYLTERYSPGYGDLPLETQKSVGRFLNCQRRIGVIISDNCLMTPVKSVTAIMGITREQPVCVIHKCENCSSRNDCKVRAARLKEKTS